MTDTPCSFYNIHGYSWKMRKISIPPCALGFTEAGLLLQERRDFQRSDCSSCRCLLLRFFRQKFGIFFSFGFGIWFQCRSWCTHKIALAFFRSSVLCSFFAGGLSSLGVPGLPWHPQILADQLTLSQPGGADYVHYINTGTPRFSDFPTALCSQDFNSASPQ